MSDVNVEFEAAIGNHNGIVGSIVAEVEAEVAKIKAEKIEAAIEKVIGTEVVVKLHGGKVRRATIVAYDPDRYEPLGLAIHSEGEPGVNYPVWVRNKRVRVAYSPENLAAVRAKVKGKKAQSAAPEFDGSPDDESPAPKAALKFGIIEGGGENPEHGESAPEFQSVSAQLDAENGFDPSGT